MMLATREAKPKRPDRTAEGVWVVENLDNLDVGPRSAPSVTAWNLLKWVQRSPENRLAFVTTMQLTRQGMASPEPSSPDRFPDLTDEELAAEYEEQWTLLVRCYKHKKETLAFLDREGLM